MHTLWVLRRYVGALHQSSSSLFMVSLLNHVEKHPSYRTSPPSTSSNICQSISKTSSSATLWDAIKLLQPGYQRDPLLTGHRSVRLGKSFRGALVQRSATRRTTFPAARSSIKRTIAHPCAGGMVEDALLVTQVSPEAQTRSGP